MKKYYNISFTKKLRFKKIKYVSVYKWPQQILLHLTEHHILFIKISIIDYEVYELMYKEYLKNHQ
jgi:hypothetical protein